MRKKSKTDYPYKHLKYNVLDCIDAYKIDHLCAGHLGKDGQSWNMIRFDMRYGNYISKLTGKSLLSYIYNDIQNYYLVKNYLDLPRCMRKTTLGRYRKECFNRVIQVAWLAFEVDEMETIIRGKMSDDEYVEHRNKLEQIQ